jgi:hypothetical protein
MREDFLDQSVGMDASLDLGSEKEGRRCGNKQDFEELVEMKCLFLRFTLESLIF